MVVTAKTAGAKAAKVPAVAVWRDHLWPHGRPVRPDHLRPHGQLLPARPPPAVWPAAPARPPLAARPAALARPPPAARLVEPLTVAKHYNYLKYCCYYCFCYCLTLLRWSPRPTARDRPQQPCLPLPSRNPVCCRRHDMPPVHDMPPGHNVPPGVNLPPLSRPSRSRRSLAQPPPHARPIVRSSIVRRRRRAVPSAVITTTCRPSTTCQLATTCRPASTCRRGHSRRALAAPSRRRPHQIPPGNDDPPVHDELPGHGMPPVNNVPSGHNIRRDEPHGHDLLPGQDEGIVPLDVRDAAAPPVVDLQCRWRQ